MDMLTLGFGLGENRERGETFDQGWKWEDKRGWSTI